MATEGPRGFKAEVIDLAAERHKRKTEQMREMLLTIDAIDSALSNKALREAQARSTEVDGAISDVWDLVIELSAQARQLAGISDEEWSSLLRTEADNWPRRR